MSIGQHRRRDRPAANVFAFAVVVFAICPTHAQEPPSAPVKPTNEAAPVAVPSSPAPKSNLERLPVETKYFKGDNGDLIAVPFDASVKDYLEFLRSQWNAPAEKLSVVSVTGVDLKGSVAGEFVTLQARITAEVTGKTHAVLFPLALHEASIQQPVTVRSAGRVIYNGKDPERGYTWWLEGNGQYEFDLKLSLPVRKSSPWRRVQLSLPVSPVTMLKLQLPAGASLPKFAAEDVTPELSALEDGVVELRASGLGPRLDLSWQSHSVQSNQPASLDANTTILVRGAADGLFIEAHQTVRALQGVFREVNVRLPDHSELLQVDGPEILETRNDPEQPEQVTLLLAQPTAGPVTFHWRVRLPHSDRKRMVLNGFEVEAAKRQAGSVGLVEVEDARWNVVDTGGPHLERMNAGEFRAAATTNGVPVVRAYRFYTQPFSLPLALESVAAYYDVQPTFALYAAEDEVRLEGRFQVHTFRGQLSQLSMLWPGWRSEGWELESVQSPGNPVASFPTDETGRADGRILFNFSDAAPDRFELRISARRRGNGEETRLTLPQPQVEGSTSSATRVVLVPAVNVNAELRALGETVLRELMHEAPPASKDFGFETGLLTQQFRLQTEERQLLLRIVPQERSVSVRSTTTARLTSRKLEIRQVILHQIDYARLNDLALVVPAEIAQRVTFHFGDRELAPEWDQGPKERVAWLTLPQSQLGEVSIELRWSLTLPEAWVGDRTATLTIPLARSQDGRTEDSTFEIERPVWFDLSSADPRWLMQHADEDVVRWQTASAAAEFPLVMSPAIDPVGAQFQISRAVIRAVVDATGGQTYRFQSRITGDGQDLYLHLPPKASNPEVWWDGKPLGREQMVELPAGSRHFSLRLPEPGASGAEHLLTVDYHLTTARPLGLSTAVAAVAPQLPQCEWSPQVVWELHLPGNQHLWAPPAGAAPLFQWQRDGWGWRRVSLPNSADIQAWLQGSLPSPPPPLTQPFGHVYAFRQLGKPQELRLRTMSTPMALVCGAGCTLAIGFLALRFPWMRSLMVVLSALCGIALLSLWYLAELELLFQPMLVGAVFPLLIGAIELWHRRRALEASWTLSASVSDYRTSSGEMPQTQSLQAARADSATIYRPPAGTDSNATRIPAESHVG